MIFGWFRNESAKMLSSKEQKGSCSLILGHNGMVLAEICHSIETGFHGDEITKKVLFLLITFLTFSLIKPWTEIDRWTSRRSKCCSVSFSLTPGRSRERFRSFRMNSPEGRFLNFVLPGKLH